MSIQAAVDSAAVVNTGTGSSLGGASYRLGSAPDPKQKYISEVRTPNSPPAYTTVPLCDLHILSDHLQNAVAVARSSQATSLVVTSGSSGF